MQKTPSRVVAPLNESLQKALFKNINFRAVLVFDKTDEYEMEIVIGSATWQSAKLSLQSHYDVAVRFELEVENNSGRYLIVAQADATHDFSVETTKAFKPSDLFTGFDDDDDTTSNLQEILAGGNPSNPAPSLRSKTQITVIEYSTMVLTVDAISPRADPIVYSITLNDNDLFTINAETGLLSFKNAITYDANVNNQYNVTVRANDGSFTSEHTIAITVTNVFDLKVNIGLKELQFNWDSYPGAIYYKIVQNRNGGNTFTELPNSGNITSLNYNHPISVHLFDQVNTRFTLQAYNENSVLIDESEPIIVTDDLNNSIGYIKSTLASAGDSFGRAVALSADSNTLVVGADKENSSSGAIHVYGRAKGTWQAQGSIKAPNSEAGDLFGFALAVSVDGTILAVGAVREESAARGVSIAPAVPDNNNTSDSGAVYVFSRTNINEAFVLQAYIRAPNTEANSLFGSSLALSSNGYTLAVGSSQEASGGAVYVYYRSNETESYSHQVYVGAPNSEPGDLFGSTLAVSGNGNTLVVGAQYEDGTTSGVNTIPITQDDNSAPNSGAVYVFGRSSNVEAFVPQAYIKAPNSESGDRFGYDIALSADGKTLVVGATGEDSASSGIKNITASQADNSAPEAGAVYLY